MTLKVTLIDVGWGDSILLDHLDEKGKNHYGLIDSNDDEYYRSTEIFLKKYFELKGYDYKKEIPVFDFIILSHCHTDHGKGLKQIIEKFGTRKFLYPKVDKWGTLGILLLYADKKMGRDPSVFIHQSIDDTKIIDYGDIKIDILWPPHDYQYNPNEENNNSIVLLLKYGDICLIFPGDAEEDVWKNISSKIPNTTCFFKVPHHGSKNGTFGNNDKILWLDKLSPGTKLGISAHIKPFKHPHPDVIQLFKSRNYEYFRTDDQYHLTFNTDGKKINEVKYSKVSIY